MVVVRPLQERGDSTFFCQPVGVRRTQPMSRWPLYAAGRKCSTPLVKLDFLGDSSQFNHRRSSYVATIGSIGRECFHLCLVFSLYSITIVMNKIFKVQIVAQCNVYLLDEGKLLHMCDISAETIICFSELSQNSKYRLNYFVILRLCLILELES